MINSLQSIINMVNLEASNIAGANINGYKKKEGFIDSNSNSVNSVGNSFYSRTNYSQGASIPTDRKTDLTIQGDGFFVLFDDSEKSSFDPNKKLSDLNNDNRFSSKITDGTFTVNGNLVTVDTANDSFNDVLAKINTATGGNVSGVYDQVKNSVTLSNSSGGPISFGAATSNFIDAARLSNSATQTGAGFTKFIESTGPVGQPSAERKLYFTRKGDFSFDDNGYLVNSRGLFVGSLDPITGNLVKTDKKTFDGLGDLTDQIHISSDGTLFNDSQLSKTGKQLALADVANPNGLVGSRLGGDLFEATEAAGKVEISRPDSDGFGLIKDQSLEASNVDIVDSLANLGIMQKFFPSTVSTLKVAFSLQDDLNNTIR